MKKFTNDLDKKERSNFLTEFWRSVTKMWVGFPMVSGSKFQIFPGPSHN
jgi:hypothetical protein